MLFHTWPFWIFFAIFYPVYFAARDTRFSLAGLWIASYVFYGWWNPLYLILIFYATFVDYWVARWMAANQRKETGLGIGLANNLLLLGFFKYAGFITENLNALIHALGAAYRIPAPDFLLPVGISFYLFKSISYTIDCYRGAIEPERSFLRYALYVSFFPQLMAGPIDRAGNLLAQIRLGPKITGNDISEGLSLFVVGLFKKLALADFLGLYVDRIFASPDRFASPALILAVLTFGWQLYFDFSGYTDMARGIARLLGFQTPLNFNHPFLATGFGDFWSRWHITLSNWLRDYIYIPLIAVGRIRHPRYILYRNTLVTMLISGLWHGAAWTFVVWGALHGIGIVATQELEKNRWYKKRFPRGLKRIGFYIALNFTWIFFRSESLSEAGTILRRIFTAGWADPAYPVWAAVLILGVLIYELLCESKWRPVLERAPFRAALMVFMILYLSVFAGGGSAPFIYLQF